jgi:pyrimidine-nucleoside phosphorylase
MTRTIVELIAAKRDGAALEAAEVTRLVDAFVAGELADYQMAAFLMAVFFRGLDDAETVALTEAMLHSGKVLDLPGVAGIKVDKHSTGGVGDKVSICLAPIVAACGVPVPMVSGRGLGHTGGTLDKLEAIPGFRTDLAAPDFARIVRDVGTCMIGQTKEIAPADKRMYALRDVTATVESIPLIVASILSKKLAEGIDGLVLDVKVGAGAFMKTEESARALADKLVRVGTRAGKDVVAVLTRMDAPLGSAVGNANETREALEVLHGGGPRDLVDCTLVLGAEMLVLGGAARDVNEATARLREAIASGAAARTMEKMVEAQTRASSRRRRSSRSRPSSCRSRRLATGGSPASTRSRSGSPPSRWAPGGRGPIRRSIPASASRSTGSPATPSRRGTCSRASSSAIARPERRSRRASRERSRSETRRPRRSRSSSETGEGADLERDEGERSGRRREREAPRAWSRASLEQRPRAALPETAREEEKPERQDPGHEERSVGVRGMLLDRHERHRHHRDRAEEEHRSRADERVGARLRPRSEESDRERERQQGERRGAARDRRRRVERRRDEAREEAAAADVSEPAEADRGGDRDRPDDDGGEHAHERRGRLRPAALRVEAPVRDVDPRRHVRDGTRHRARRGTRGPGRRCHEVAAALDLEPIIELGRRRTRRRLRLRPGGRAARRQIRELEIRDPRSAVPIARLCHDPSLSPPRHFRREPGATASSIVARWSASDGPVASSIPCETSLPPKSRGARFATTTTRLPTSASGVNVSASPATIVRGSASPRSTVRRRSLSFFGTFSHVLTSPTRRSSFVKSS